MSGLDTTYSTPDNLVIRENAIPQKKITILSGQNISRGDLLGQQDFSVPTTGTAGGSNTGDGTMTGVTGGKDVEVGVYTLTCIAAAADSGTFKVVTPSGDMLDDATVAVAYTSSHLNFTINDGATDFIVGDVFTVTVAAGGGKYLLSLAAATDGSQIPDLIASKDVDASTEDKEGYGYQDGAFNSDAMTFGTGHTAASVADELRKKNIVLEARGAY
jgi:hypothetical protein